MSCGSCLEFTWSSVRQHRTLQSFYFRKITIDRVISSHSFDSEGLNMSNNVSSRHRIPCLWFSRKLKNWMRAYSLHRNNPSTDVSKLKRWERDYQVQVTGDPMLFVLPWDRLHSKSKPHFFGVSTKLSAGGGNATSSVWRIHWACDPVRVHHPICRHISPGPSPSPHQQHIWDQDRCIQIHHPAEEAGRRPSQGYWDLAPNSQLYQLHGCVFKCEQIVNLRKRKCNVLMTPLWFSFHRPW